jgi:hypothetical protein
VFTGTLLLHAFQGFERALFARYAERGEDALRPKHGAVIANIDPEGTRPSVLADRAGMTRPAMGELIDELESYLPAQPPTGPATQPMASMELQTRLGAVRLFTVIATLGAPLEVTAANLAIETFLPVDDESAARLRELDTAGRAARRRIAA